MAFRTTRIFMSTASQQVSSSSLSLTFVSGNANKIRETSDILGSAVPNLVAMKLDLPELQGDPIEISKEKCRIAARLINAPVIVEDTALCFNALKGLPGPYIKWFLEKLGHGGLNQMIAGFDDKSAYALCTFSFARCANDEPKTFIGKCPGKIVPARGDNKFGWDPIFEPDGVGQTFAEMDKDAKNKISHRSLALAALKQFFADNPEVLLASASSSSDNVSEVASNAECNSNTDEKDNK